MTNSRRVLLVVLCLIFTFGIAPEINAQYLHPKLQKKTVTIRQAVILPAKIEIVKESAKGSEMMIAQSEEISKAVSAAVLKTLEEKKIGVIKDSFQPADLDESRKYQLADIQSRYDALLPQLMKKSKDVKKARFTLGDEVMLLNVDKSTDILVFIRGTGRVFTKGKTAFSLINIFSLDFPLAQITVGIVDAHSGEVLAFTKPLTATKALKDPKSLSKMITKSLKKLPQSS
ncbi:MAG TPA: hypothetical protein VJ875_24455 [Pyrinomonadaceae bacterium]|nr:hypothetical protein [Pyrinomonadaceae bacterium]